MAVLPETVSADTANAADVATAASTPVPGVPIVRITALRKSYGTNEVLKGIDLDVMRGEVIALIGKSG
jgi:polar amino acid transport system ATP-binding protein